MKKDKKLYNRIIPMGLIVLLMAALFVISVVANRFGGTIYDLVVYAIGTVMIAVTGCVAVCVIPFEEIISSLSSEEGNRNILQTVGFCIISLMTLYYYNSASEYGHNVAMEVIAICLLAIILSFATKEELCHPLTQWITIIAMCLCLGKGIYKHYSDHRVIVLFVEERIRICLFACALAILAVRIFKRTAAGRLTGVGLLSTVYLALTILFYNTRRWTLYTAILFLLIYFRPIGRQRGLEIVKNYAWGVILAFWCMFGSAILFRPYYSFEFTRYPGWFSSVASAALFWIISFDCALTVLLVKWEKGKRSLTDNLKCCFIEILTMGVVSSHLLMSMSRTSLLTVSVTALICFVMAELVKFRDSMAEISKKILVICVGVILIFPGVYTLARCVPAMVGLPYRVSGAEWFSDQIEIGEVWNSSKFMNIPQFAETFLEKVAGVDINLSEMAGAHSGPVGLSGEDSGEQEIMRENSVGMYEINGQLYTMSDYTFVNDSEGEESNGRFDILKEYWKHLNMTGHVSTQIEEVEVKHQAYHAHNTFMQVAFDFGIPTGIVFILLVFFAIGYAVVYYKKNGLLDGYSIFPVAVLISFAVAGLTEWIFHPSIPLGFGFMIGLVPLFTKEDK